MQTQSNIFTSLRTAVNYIYMYMLARRMTSTRPRSSLQLHRSCTLGVLETNTPPSTTYQIFKTPHVHSSGTHARITCAWGSYIKGAYLVICVIWQRFYGIAVTSTIYFVTGLIFFLQWPYAQRETWRDREWMRDAACSAQSKIGTAFVTK